MPKLRENFRDYFARSGVAAIVFPATMVPATLIGQDEVTIGDRKVSFTTAISRNIAPGSTAGLPGLVLPAGLTKSGLPVSLEFDGPSGTDRALLALGLSMEVVLGHFAAAKGLNDYLNDHNDFVAYPLEEKRDGPPVRMRRVTISGHNGVVRTRVVRSARKTGADQREAHDACLNFWLAARDQCGAICRDITDRNRSNQVSTLRGHSRQSKKTCPRPQRRTSGWDMPDRRLSGWSWLSFPANRSLSEERSHDPVSEVTPAKLIKAEVNTT